MDKDELDFLSPFQMNNEEGAIEYGRAVLASMLLDEDELFSEQQFVEASRAFYAGLFQIYPWLAVKLTVG